MTDEQYLERLIEEYGDVLLRMCCLWLRDYYLAEDALQETFIKAMKGRENFEHKSSEKTWLIRIAINCCKNIRRKQKFLTVSYDLENMPEEEGENPIEELLEKNSISGAVMKLKEKDREIIILYYYNALSVKEIAQIVGKAENTTVQRLHRARGRLKKILMEAGYGKN